MFWAKDSGAQGPAVGRRPHHDLIVMHRAAITAKQIAIPRGPQRCCVSTRFTDVVGPGFVMAPVAGLVALIKLNSGGLVCRRQTA